ncbi:MAG: Polyketide cyclase / dehydrase and lipid transport [Acidobacteria bacterium]|nr:Polyketide cyclase / dehydrase and lipid transport [Acidobacteriota bacterium]
MASMAFAFRRGSTGGQLIPAAAVLLFLWPTASASGQPAAGRVSVSEERGVYTVLARFIVEQPPSVALAVLTDYEHISQFMPGVQSSTVLERSAGRTSVEQEAVSSWPCGATPGLAPSRTPCSCWSSCMDC